MPLQLIGGHDYGGAAEKKALTSTTTIDVVDALVILSHTVYWTVAAAKYRPPVANHRDVLSGGTTH